MMIVGACFFLVANVDDERTVKMSCNTIPNLLIISNKNKRIIIFITYTKQKEYLCGKLYSYETKNIRKNRVFQSYRTHVWTWNDDYVDGPEACRQELCDAANL